MSRQPAKTLTRMPRAYLRTPIAYSTTQTRNGRYLMHRITQPVNRLGSAVHGRNGITHFGISPFRRQNLARDLIYDHFLIAMKVLVPTDSKSIPIGIKPMSHARPP